MWEILAFIGALAVLVEASRWTINASIRLSDHYGISKLAFGFVIVAIFVSLPDMMVAILSATGGNADLGVGDALGSTVANICLVIGVATVFRKIKISRKHIVDSAEMLLLISLIPLVLIVNAKAHTAEGLILLAVFLFYVFFVMKSRIPSPREANVKHKDIPLVIGTFLVGILFVTVSAYFLVQAAVTIAQTIGVSPAIIGLTLVSLGTTIPELVINFTAVRKGEVALAIGEILGSSMINLTLVLGSAFAFSTNAVDFSIFIVPVAFIVMANSVLVYHFIKHEEVGRAQGVIFLSMYVIFIFMQVASTFLH